MYKKSNTILQCDVIGSPANYPTEWITQMQNGTMEFTPLLVGENGEDYIPDGTSKIIKLSKKTSDANMLLGLYSDNNGATWGARTITGHINTTTNSAVSQAYPIGRLEMLFYTTHTNMAEPTVNSAVRNGIIGDVAALSYSNSSTWYPNFLLQSMIGKVATNIGLPFADSVDVESIVTIADDKIYSSIQPKHSSILLNNVNSPAVKAFPYLTTENGRKVVNLVFKEMKYDTTWGDDDKFNIVNNVSTTTDDNANVVLIGQKKIVTPYFAKEK